MTKPDPAETRAPYHHGDLRAHLIAAVRGLVETHGPEGFSIAQAARLAGVSSAAPYKHFRDRPEILRAVAADGMDRLHAAMAEAAARHPAGTLQAVAQIGLAYVRFARQGPGVFRLVFGLTEGHEDDPQLLACGEACFGVIAQAVADCLRRRPDDPETLRRTYMLWSFVHGHSFLTIDDKATVASTPIEDWDYLMAVSAAVLGTRPTRS